MEGKYIALIGLIGFVGMMIVGIVLISNTKHTENQYTMFSCDKGYTIRLVVNELIRTISYHKIQNLPVNQTINYKLNKTSIINETNKTK